MPRGIPNKPAAAQVDNEIRGIMANIVAGEMPTAPAPAPAAPKMVTMKLDRHYRPASEFEVVGHFQPEIRRKGANGQEVIVQAEEFIAGEMMPAPRPGVEITGKIWAGTVLRVPEAEARTMNRAKIGVPSIEA